jgi:glucose-6-phosphate-specific signal transduction histidine kinase
LFGIYERAAFVGGAMKISARLTGGTELIVRIPKSAPVAGEQ